MSVKTKRNPTHCWVSLHSTQPTTPNNEKGERARPASWFMGICPTEPGFHAYRLEELQELLRTLDVDGVWMDYVHWHAQFEEPEPILPETCFCENCLSLSHFYSTYS